MSVFEIVAAGLWVCGYPFACAICWRSSGGHPLGIVVSALWPLWLPFFAQRWDARLDVVDWAKRFGQ
jgi:hypothetical protein